MSPEELNARFTPEERRENAIKANRASQEARRQNRLLKDSLEVALKLRMMKDGKQATHPVTGEPLDAFDAGMVKIVERYAKGDPKAVEIVAKLLGQWVDKTENKHEISTPVIVVADQTEKDAIERIKAQNEGERSGA